MDWGSSDKHSSTSTNTSTSNNNNKTSSSSSAGPQISSVVSSDPWGGTSAATSSSSEPFVATFPDHHASTSAATAQQQWPVPQAPDPWTPQPASSHSTSEATAPQALQHAQVSSLLPPLPELKEPSLSRLENKLGRLHKPRGKMSGRDMLREFEQAKQHGEELPPIDRSARQDNADDDAGRDASSEWGSSDEEDNGLGGDSKSDDEGSSKCARLFWCCTCCFRRKSRQRPRFLGSGVRRLPKSMDYRPLLASDDEDEDDVIFSSISQAPSSRNVIEAAQNSPRSHPPPSSVFALSDSDSDLAFTTDAKPIQP